MEYETILTGIWYGWFWTGSISIPKTCWCLSVQMSSAHRDTTVRSQASAKVVQLSPWIGSSWRVWKCFPRICRLQAPAACRNQLALPGTLLEKPLGFTGEGFQTYSMQPAVLGSYFTSCGVSDSRARSVRVQPYIANCCVSWSPPLIFRGKAIFQCIPSSTSSTSSTHKEE